MIVNVCPAAVTRASPERVWAILTAPERFGDWVDADFVSATPHGAAAPGQVIQMSAPEFGRRWPVRIDVGEMDPGHGWIDLVAYLPFGIANHERITLTAIEGGTLVRFN